MTKYVQLSIFTKTWKATLGQISATHEKLVRVKVMRINTMIITFSFLRSLLGVVCQIYIIGYDVNIYRKKVITAWFRRTFTTYYVQNISKTIFTRNITITQQIYSTSTFSKTKSASPVNTSVYFNTPSRVLC